MLDFYSYLRLGNTKKLSIRIRSCLETILNKMKPATIENLHQWLMVHGARHLARELFFLKGSSLHHNTVILRALALSNNNYHLKSPRPNLWVPDGSGKHVPIYCFWFGNDFETTQHTNVYKTRHNGEQPPRGKTGNTTEDVDSNFGLIETQQSVHICDFWCWGKSI